jgi:glycosyltransferase involved in cell wall biosynthesis
MKVLMQTRPDIYKRGGGDFIQMSKTKEFLEKLNVEIDISTDSKAKLKYYDVVHIFNTPFFDHSYACLINAKNQGKPIAFSTIYWNQEELALECYKGKFQLLKNFLGKRLGKQIVRLKNELSKNGQLFKKILHESDVLLPNSEVEKKFLIKDFYLDADKKFVIVPNAVDSKLFIKLNPLEFVKRYKVKDFILCVGRIECRKNQHNLIEALNGTKVPLVLVGSTEFDKDYYQLCLEKAKQRDNVIFINDLPHDQLPSVYAAAKVHALPSWYDTPGLSNLEAILANCNIVTTDRGPMYEYFQDMVWLCAPGDLDSIKRAVFKAYEAPFNQKLKDFIIENFTWQKTAQKTLDAYRLIFKNKNP